MNDQQRAAMQMALEALENIKAAISIVDDGPDDSDIALAHEYAGKFGVQLSPAICSLKEQLSKPLNDCVPCCDSCGGKLGTAVLPCQSCEVLSKGEHKTDGTPCWCNPEVTYENPETGAKVIVHKEPQGEWVDLTPNEVTEQIREGAADGGWQGFAQRITTKFKSKNTPPVVPKGAPKYWTYMVNNTWRKIETECPPDDAYDEGTLEPLYTIAASNNSVGDLYQHFLSYTGAEHSALVCRAYFDGCNATHEDYESYMLENPEKNTPPVVKAAIEAIKEKAAKVCEEMHNEIGLYDNALVDCAAAIRSMK